MARTLELHDDRLFPADAGTRDVARQLYSTVAALPIISPHGHTDARWFADDTPWTDATSLLLAPDHYLYRMLFSQGIALDTLGIARQGETPERDPRAAWRVFAANQHLFRGTPSRLWLDHVFAEVFGFHVALDAETADFYFDTIAERLASDAFRPRALFDRFGIEFLATTEGPHDDLDAHHRISGSGWAGRVVTTYRPDAVIDVEHEGFGVAMAQFAALTGEDVYDWSGYLRAHRQRRADFRAAGATATDHGHPTAATANLSAVEAEALFRKVTSPGRTADDAALFRAQMLTEMAAMSADDNMVMQLHPGSFRNHNARLFASHGRDKGADIPTRTDYVHALKPLLDRFGASTTLSIILFTLDESALCARTCAARRALSVPQAGAGVVVPRQSRRDAAVPRDDDRDGGLLQHRRFQRRHARVSVDPGASTAGSSRGLSSSIGSTKTRLRRWQSTFPITLQKGRIACDGDQHVRTHLLRHAPRHDGMRVE